MKCNQRASLCKKNPAFISPPSFAAAVLIALSAIAPAHKLVRAETTPQAPPANETTQDEKKDSTLRKVMILNGNPVMPGSDLEQFLKDFARGAPTATQPRDHSN